MLIEELQKESFWKPFL